jgi:hypothetical protein
VNFPARACLIDPLNVLTEDEVFLEHIDDSAPAS